MTQHLAMLRYATLEWTQEDSIRGRPEQTAVCVNGLHSATDGASICCTTKFRIQFRQFGLKQSVSNAARQ